MALYKCCIIIIIITDGLFFSHNIDSAILSIHLSLHLSCSRIVSSYFLLAYGSTVILVFPILNICQITMPPPLTGHLMQVGYINFTILTNICGKQYKMWP